MDPSLERGAKLKDCNAPNWRGPSGCREGHPTSQFPHRSKSICWERDTYGDFIHLKIAVLAARILNSQKDARKMRKLRKGQDFSSDKYSVEYLRKPWREPTSTPTPPSALSLSVPKNERCPSIYGIYNPHAQSSPTATMAFRSTAIYE
jgi:hypothetical protein